MKEIELSKKGWKNKGKYKALVDDDVFEEVNKYDWSYDTGYASNSKMKIKLHRYIWTLKYGEIPADKEVEHKDQNGLNNQISNLRLATSSENNCNKSKQKNNKSGFKGISKEVLKGHRRKDETYKIYTRWRVEITKDKKTYTKTFPYTDEGLQEAVEYYKNMSLDVQEKFSIYNRDK